MNVFRKRFCKNCDKETLHEIEQQIPYDPDKGRDIFVAICEECGNEETI